MLDLQLTNSNRLHCMIKKSSLGRNIYTQFLLRILILYFLFFFTRILFYLFNYELFEGTSFSALLRIFQGGLQFDTTAIIYLNGLFILMSLSPLLRSSKFYNSSLKYIYIITNSLGLLANYIDIIYYRFTSKRTTSSVFQEFEHESNFGKLVLMFLVDYWYISLLFILSVLLLIKLYKKTEFNTSRIFENKILHAGFSIIMLVLFAVLSIGGIRGGFTRMTRPISISNAGQYVEKPSQVAIVLNTPFSVIRTIGKNDYKRKAYFNSDEELEEVFNPEHFPNPNSSFVPKNVVVFVLESCAREHSKFANEHLWKKKNYKGYMPFLDSLMSVSKTFVNAYANGHKSIDALPSVTTSIPRITQVPYVLSHRSTNKVNSLASLLEQKGYNSNFFFGSPNGSMGFEALMRMAGYDQVYDMGDYNNNEDFDGYWGIWDEKFMQYFAKKMNTLPTPFVSTIFTLSSHHPFNIPDEYKEKFKPGEVPLQRCISYTDYAIKQFFKTASKMPWFKNTLFVFTADHTNQTVHDFYRTELQRCAVPLFFYAPADKNFKGIDYQLAQQIDILPTVMSYLNFDKPYVSFGNNLLDSNNVRFVVNNSSSFYQFAMGDYVILFDEKKTKSMYNYKTDLLNKQNLVGTLPELQLKMETKLKAIIQQYNNRMIDNDLTVK